MQTDAPLPVDDIPLLPSRRWYDHTLLLRRDPIAFLGELSRAGDLCRVQLLDKKVIVVLGPDQIAEAMLDGATSTEKSALFRYALYPLVGEGLLTSRGPLWRKQRKLMAPIFTPAQIASFADAMVGCAERTAATWTDGQTIDAWRETTRITMSVAGKTLFDAETFSEADDLGAALTCAFEWSADAATSTSAVLQMGVRSAVEQLGARLDGALGARARDLAERLNGPLVLMGERGRRVKDAIALLDRRVQRMIEERRAGEPRPDLLGRLLAAHDEDDGTTMTDRQVRDEVLTLFIAGHETTATALAWSIHLLVGHPAIYQAARAEADALGRAPRREDMARLRLLPMVFKEALRLYTPLPMFNRDVVKDMRIGGHLVPAGSVLVLAPHATHHRADLWPEPERFDPERFTPEAEAARHKHAYVPFSAGPRICIGNHFALMEGALVLATLLQRADFERVGPSEVTPEVHGTLRPRGGVPMRVRPRGRPDRRVASGAVPHPA